MKTIKLLICDDDPIIISCYQEILMTPSESKFINKNKLTFECQFAEQGELAILEIKKSLQEKECLTIIFLDINMPLGMDGLSAALKIKEIDPKIEIVMISSFLEYTYENVIKKLNSPKKVHFYNKPFYPIQLMQIRDSLTREWIEKTDNTSNKKSPPSFLKHNLTSSESNVLISQSPKMISLIDMVHYIANFDETVLIQGESGTGKEVIAQEIHNKGRIRKGNFIAFNAAALSENLIESELFGHEEGAYTGANNEKKGRFELAQNGTIFIDEIGELSLETQVKLLRVLQERSFERVGGTTLIRTNARVLAATNKDLKIMTEEGTFRSDLYYRLCVIPLVVPPLRERKEDILPLFEYFLCLLAKKNQCEIPEISREALSMLDHYDWPGNVRELSNIVSRAFILSKGKKIVPEAFQLPQLNHSPSPNSPIQLQNLIDCEHLTESEMNKKYAKSVFKKHDCNKSKTARSLGIDIKTLNKRLS